MGKGLRVTLKVAAAQAGISILAALGMYGFSTLPMATSLMIGGAIGILGTLVLGFRMFYPDRVRTGDENLRLFYRAERQKFLVTAVLLIVALKWWSVSAIPFFAGFLLAVVVNWAMLPLIKN